jgi:Sec-independent protein translocase protein TatA
MLLFINNVNPTELLLIAVVAVLVFGRRLPEVAGQAAGQLAKAKKAVQDLRRESGLDEELRQARQAAQDLDPRRLVDAPKPVRAADSVQRGRSPVPAAPAGLPAAEGPREFPPRGDEAAPPEGAAGSAAAPASPQASTPSAEATGGSGGPTTTD